LGLFLKIAKNVFAPLTTITVTDVSCLAFFRKYIIHVRIKLVH